MSSMANWKHAATMYCEDNATAEATTDATPRILSGMTWVSGLANGMTVDTANDAILATKAGVYKALVTICFSGSLSKTFVVEIYNGTTGTKYKLTRKLGTGGDVGSASCHGDVTLAVGDAISLYHSSTDGGTAFTATDVQLSVELMYEV